jgi:uncharacterized protein (TIGR02246 family)
MHSSFPPSARARWALILALLATLSLSAPSLRAQNTAAAAPATPTSGTATADYPDAAAKTADIATVAGLYYNWLTTVAAAHGDPTEVLKLYAPDAILVATYSPVLLLNENGDLNGYFKKFTSLPSLSATTQDLQTRVYGDWALNTGLYTFTFKDPEGDPVAVPARFTFVYHKINGQWYIIDHHSSLVPPSL